MYESEKILDLPRILRVIPGKTNRSRWASRTGGEDPAGEWLPLWVHLTDTAGVMSHLVRDWLPEKTKRAVCRDFPEDQLGQVAAFLALTHDIGKFTPVMLKRLLNAADGEVWERMKQAGFDDSMLALFPQHEGKSPHARAGEAILLHYQCPDSLAVIVGAHHGKPQSSGKDVRKQMDDYPRNYYGDAEANGPAGRRWEGIRDAWMHYALSEAGYSSVSELPDPGMSAQMLLTGLVIMADWIASNTDYFPLIPIGESGDDICPRERVQEGWDRLALPEPWGAERYFLDPEDFQATFGFCPRSLQNAVIAKAGECTAPGLMILEAPMGEGKTEAALAAAEIFATRAGCGGIFFGLPTQATANGIFPRLERWAEKQSEETVHSIRLAHGMAELNEDYCAIFHGSASVEEDNPSEGLITHEWFRGRKQALLSEFVIGTVDQLLLAALKQKHIMLRHLGLAGKVVILDEVHSYDAYMSQYLDRALSWLGSYGTPVIMLSATLPAERREEMVRAYLGTKQVQGEEGWEENRNYPLLTWTDGGKVRQEKLTADLPSRDIRIVRGTDEEIDQYLERALQDGGCAGVIVNTVRRAQIFAQEIRRKFPEKTVVLIHAGFVASDRTKKETFVLNHVGADSLPSERNNLIVVGTQVLEQSLDIDFDFLVTDLCPMDLLLQRIGRLQRHERVRPRPLRHSYCVVLGMDGKLEEGAEKIYGSWLLLRTRMMLPERISLPEDISGLVQDTYAEPTPELLADSQMEESWKAYNRELEKKERKADAFRLKEPEKSSKKVRQFVKNKKELIRGLLDTDVPDSGKTEEIRDAKAQATVRDTDPSVEVLVMVRNSDGQIHFLPWQCGGAAVAADRPPSEEESRQIARQRLQLPRNLCYPSVMDQTIDELEEMNRTFLAEWQRAPMLRGELILLLDEEFRAEIQGYQLQYSRENGIFCEKGKKGDE